MQSPLYIAEIARNVRLITRDTPATDKVWDTVITAVKNASQAFNKIHQSGLGALALEQDIRARLEKG